MMIPKGNCSQHDVIPRAKGSCTSFLRVVVSKDKNSRYAKELGATFVSCKWWKKRSKIAQMWFRLQKVGASAF
ncbi:hypothetical protein V6Z11_D08G169300 [Gossypium hirsutum]